MKTGKLINGQHYGQLEAISEAGSNKAGCKMWNMKCICGVEKPIAVTAILSGGTKSCGCLRAKGRKISTDFTGQTFGMLEAMGQDLSRPKPGVWWLMKCKCGKVTSVHSANVRRYTACGCQRSLPDGVAARNAVIGNYKRWAKRRGRDWMLTNEDFFTLTQKLCHYCGAPPAQVAQVSNGTGRFIYNGVDRKDNGLGYTEENAVACCGFCNFMKGKLPYQEFIDWLKRAGTYQLGYSISPPSS